VIHAPNRNYVWTHTFVQALAEAGLRNVVISPGSRSTPLTMAFARHPDIRVYSHIDERGAAFMALGLALAQDAPSAVVCSSGTAAANFYPAIVEAHYAHVPLLVLTADRPHELRDSGANQTVDQVKMYGDHVLWSVDVAPPEANPPDVALRNLRSLAARAYALADRMPKGAVHLNFPFRKPLEPTEVSGEGRELAWGLNAKPSPQTPLPQGEGLPYEEPVGTTYTSSAEGYRAAPRIERGVLMPTEAQIERLAQMLRDSKRRLIVCGPRTPGGEFPQQVEALGEICGGVLLADGISNVRQHHMAFGSYEWYIREAAGWGDPDIVLHFGAMPVSQALDDYLNKVQPKHRIVISEDAVWTDFNHRVDWLLHADPAALCSSLCKLLTDSGSDDDWWQHFVDSEALVTEDDNLYLSDIVTTAFFDAAAVSEVAHLLPYVANVFLASSLAVRHWDQFNPISDSPDVCVYCNRGASGIDGTISSALGVAAAGPDKPTVLIIGDLAFYHDMNALLAAKRNGIKNFVIVLLNNNGGQIFRRLPINQPEFEPEFTELFITPHGMTFEHTAAQFGFAYGRAEDRDGVRAAFATALASGEPSIVEVVTDAEEDAKSRKALMAKVAEAVKGIAN
jgi:2-succinyl-5-enolpyruvyl-6-hydroxy-3-cyclohexene-1-carboxylate synthase